MYMCSPKVHKYRYVHGTVALVNCNHMERNKIVVPLYYDYTTKTQYTYKLDAY